MAPGFAFPPCKWSVLNKLLPLCSQLSSSACWLDIGFIHREKLTCSSRLPPISSPTIWGQARSCKKEGCGSLLTSHWAALSHFPVHPCPSQLHIQGRNNDSTLWGGEHVAAGLCRSSKGQDGSLTASLRAPDGLYCLEMMLKVLQQPLGLP